MELAAILIILGFFILGVKIFGIVFKASLIVLSLPFIVIASLVLTVLFFVLFPVAVVAGALSFLLIPLSILGPALPVILLALIIFAITR